MRIVHPSSVSIGMVHIDLAPKTLFKLLANERDNLDLEIRLFGLALNFI